MTSATQVLEQSVVVFSHNYLPLCRVNIKRAIVLLVTNKAEPLEINTVSGWQVHSPSLVVYVPKQIRLKITSCERIWKVSPVNRREVLRRDRYSCQYCGSSKNLTLDHVIPRSRGGQHTWDNVVAACERCNSSKGDRTLKEIGMHLRTTPKAPVHPVIAFAEQFWLDLQINLE
ncbi:HNH endonuclease [Chlorogloeopsis sp. ULAP01]|uniref:HNH endonuclease n=1 Tax=Chlorogloeopsis sp. ULAP01 TaxID=3056483 RepID=UPI0025AB14F0|nr:HNH endonuclease [Chlorogloeopsis sp. ULAP01]MDM9383123.1 HNH endonuclease [Chlorogloeopsis sp. ULAP01]